MPKRISELHILALASHGRGISGGDRIFIELARRWSKEFPIVLHTWKEGRQMCARQNLEENKDLRFKLYELGIFSRLGFLLGYLARVLVGVKVGMTLTLDNRRDVYIYSASEFWMDCLPCVLLKLRYKEVRWVATWFQTAPNPIKGFAEVKRKEKYRLNAFLYWFAQLPIRPLISNFADYVLVNNESERRQFGKLADKGRVVVVIGAVDVEKVKSYKPKAKSKKLAYDAVFQGRFHAQKGVVELIDIWRKVVDKKPDAKLAMIGDGPLMKDIRRKIKKLKLANNVKLFGYLFDGNKKYQVFSRSKIVLHPAFYDSGGMATAEAMAFGLPAIGFDLKSYESYYPKGMVKVKRGNLSEFSEAILTLLADGNQRRRLGREAKKMIFEGYSWDRRAKEVYEKIIK